MPMDRTAFYADASTPASITTITAAMADAEADTVVALTGTRSILSFKWANAAARTAQTGMTEGDIGYQLDTNTAYTYDGSAWVSQSAVTAWTTYTPTLTNFAVGTGGSASSVTRYRYVGTMIEVDYKYVLGTVGSSVTNPPRISLPVTANASYAAYSIRGLGSFIDSSAGPLIVMSFAVIFNTTTAGLHMNTVGPPIQLANPTATVPFTWAAGDIIAGSFTYEP